MINKTCTLPRRSASILLTGMVCAAMVALFVAGIARGGNVAHAFTTICNVKSFGAVGDGIHKDTAALQKAIDSCSGQSGQLVEVPPGTYLSAPLYLRSNLFLQIDTGATLDASQTLSDYTIPPGVTLHTKVLAFLNGYKISNVQIAGGGVINGEGAVWWATGRAADERPRLIELDYVTHAHIGGIGTFNSGIVTHLENAGSAHVYAFGSTGISAEQITVTAPSNSPNTDGVVFSNSQNSAADECSIDTGGDNIAIVSGIGESSAPQLGSSSIFIACQFQHGQGVSIGSGITGGIHDINVSGKFNGTTNGIRIQSNRTVGGEVAHISYIGLTMTNVAHPIIFSAYSPPIPSSDTPHPITTTTPYYHDITVENLVATGASDGGTVVGVPEKPFTAITFNAVTITAQTGLVVRNATVTVIPPTPTPPPTVTPIVTPPPTPTPTATPTPVCSVHYVVTSQWPGAFSGSLTITNTGSSTLNGWSLQFSFANGQTITQGWDGTFTQSSSSVTIANASYNALLVPGASVNPGFNGSWKGSNTNPTAFTLNGQACSVV